MIKNKAFAIFLGAAGVGIISPVLNFSNFIVTICSIGIPLGLVKYISEHEVSGNKEKINVLVKNTLVWFITLSFIFMLLVFFFSGYLSDAIFSTVNYSYLLVIAAIAFPFTVINSILEAVLRGFKRFRLYAKLSAFFSIASLVISVSLAYFWKIDGVIIAISLTAAISTIIYIVFFNKEKLVNLKEIIKTRYQNSVEFKNVFKIGFASLIGGFLGQLVLLAIRSIIIDKFGFTGSGLFQSVFALSTNLFSFFFTAISVYSIPVLSGMKNPDESAMEINNTFRFTLFFILPVASVAFVFRDILILILFSKNFESASQLFFYYLLGDFFKALAWVSGIWFIPNLKIKTWLILEINFNLIYIIVFYILVTYANTDLNSVSIAYFISNFVHFIACFYFFKKYSGFKLQKENLFLFIASTSTIFFVFIFSSFSQYYSYFILIPTLIFWFFIVSSKDERKKIIQIFKNKIS